MVTAVKEEKEADLKKEITPRLRVWLKRLKDSTPQHFMVSICKNSPMVVMPNGRIYIQDPQHSREFNDAIAETFASQEGGLYFPSSAEESFPISRFIDAINILIPNSREETKKLAEKPEAFADLLEDSTYLEGEVYPEISDWLSGFTGYLNLEKLGLKGLMHISFKMRLGLEGFGYYHFGVSGRTLSAKLCPYGIKEDSPEYNLITGYIGSKNLELRDQEKIGKYLRLGLSFAKQPFEDILLEITSPGFYEPNESLGFPVMKTREMAQYFSGIVQRVDYAILKAKNIREKQAGKERDYFASIMGLK